MSRESTTKVLIADDQTLFAESLRDLIERHATDMEVVGIASDGNDAVSLALDTGPDVVLMDIRMPNMDGLRAAEIIRNERPRIRIILLTTFDDDIYVEAALKNHLSGYILKDVNTDELIAAVRAASAGMMSISPSVASHLAVRQENESEQEPPGVDEGAAVIYRRLNSLTRRETEILRLLVEGYSNKEIAGELHVTEQTIKNHISAVYEKLGCHHRMQIMRTYRDFVH